MLINVAGIAIAVPITTQPAPELITLSFPDNLELKVFIEYVSERLGVNFIYDEQAINQRITIKSPTQIPKALLLDLLEGTLKIKGLVLADAEQKGWKRIVPIANLSTVAQTSTQPVMNLIGSSPAATVLQAFPLRFADPAKVEPVIKPFLSQPGGSSVAIADPKLLIVTDFVSNVRRISELVLMLDREQAAVEVKFQPVRQVDAGALAQQLSQILIAKGKSLGGVTVEPLEVTQDPRTNQLVLVGTPQRIQEADSIISSLDVPLGMETRIYAFQTASAERVDRLAKELVGSLNAKRLYQSVVEREANLLVVTATPELHQRVAALKQTVDVPVTQEQSPIRFYKLQNATAADVLQTIRSIEGGEMTSAATDRTEASTSPASPFAIAPSGIPGANLPPNIPGSPAPAPPIYHDSQQTTAPTTSPSMSRPAVQSFKSGSTTVTADPNTNTIIVVAPPEQQRLYEQLIHMLDKRRPQVLVEATIVTLDTTNSFSLGVEIGSMTGNDNHKVITFSSFGLSTVGKDDNLGRLTLTPGVGFNGALVSTDIADIVIQALETNSHAKVLSAPRILVNDNATGTLASVSEAPFVSVNASNTIATTSFAGYASAGTTVSLTPHISEGEHLQLKYTIALNSFTGKGGSGSPPPRQTDSVQSEVTVPDGHTVIIGGLNRNNYSQTKDSVPILGRIPLLEYLFSNRTQSNSQSTLFVFLRPVILRDDQFEDLKFYSERDLKAAGLPGEYPESDPLTLQ